MRNDLRMPTLEPEPLREYLLVLRRRKWTVALLTLLTVASALAFSFRQTPVYTSTARMLVTSADPSAPSLETQRALIESTAVAEVAAENLGLKVPAGDLLKGLSASLEPNTAIIVVRYTHPDPLEAQRLADGFAQAFLDFRRRQLLGELEARTALTQRRIQETKDDLADVEASIVGTDDPDELGRLNAERDQLLSRLAVLQQELEDLAPTSLLAERAGEVVQPADLPVAPSSPDHVRNGLLALAVGLALGVGLAFLRERLDEQLRGREDLEAVLGAPTLGVVPHVREWRRGAEARLVSLGAPYGAAAEAYRTIRTNLQFLSRDGQLQVLTVTSPWRGEGKTATAANLAVVLSQTGKRVIAVDCDLRRPRLGRFFGLEHPVGLTSVLAGEATLAQAPRPVEGLDSLRVLASGPTPGNPTELLSSKVMDRVLEELRRAADFVILDAPPVLVVSDVLALVPRSDGVLVVADASATTRTMLGLARAAVEQVGGRIVGGALNNLDPSRARYYPGHYDYAYTYGRAGGEPSGDGLIRSPEPRRTRRSRRP